MLLCVVCDLGSHNSCSFYVNIADLHVTSSKLNNTLKNSEIIDSVKVRVLFCQVFDQGTKIYIYIFFSMHYFNCIETCR